MKTSVFILPTLKEAPADAQAVSHIFMLRAGLIRKEAAGIYDLLPLGLRVKRKVEGIIREEMDRSGALEVQLPLITGADLWEKSGRWGVMGAEMFRLSDRHQNRYALGPTHEEAMTALAASLVKSYRDLPRHLYQIGLKFRDEIRPRYGVIRSRSFTMKDSYSFHRDADDLNREYEKMRGVYRAIFARLGLKVRPVFADSGAMGGSQSEEFMVPSVIGEAVLLSCPSCDYAGNQEKVAFVRDQKKVSYSGDKAGEIATPGKKTMGDLTAFFGCPPEVLVKAVVYMADETPVLAFVRGDRDINETKLKNMTRAAELRPATEEEILKHLDAPAGFIGLENRKLDGVSVLVDDTLRDIGVGITGGGRVDTHAVVDVAETLARRFAEPQAKHGDLVQALAGDPCPGCGAGRLEESRGIEVGHIFKLGYKYSQAFEMNVTDEQGKPFIPIMGTYGIGLERSIATIIEQNHDTAGIVFPRAVAPFEAVIIPITQKDEEKSQVAEFYRMLCDAGVDTLLDDRDERPGVKFADADLIGFPVRITLGKSWFGGEKIAEVRLRKEKEARKIACGGLAELVPLVRELLAAYDGSA